MADRGLFDVAGYGIGVTGGAGYLGSAMVFALAEAGAIVVTCDTNEDGLKRLEEEAASKQLRGRITCIRGSVSSAEVVEAALERLAGEAGAVNGWVNNAYAGVGGLLLDVSRDQLETVFRSGMIDVIAITQAVARRMAQGGSIVNIGSMYGMVSPQPDTYRQHPRFHNPPAYGAAKAGVIQFTRYAACHLAAMGIRVNCISPGPFPGPVASAEATFISELSSRVPLGRVGVPEELVGAVMFLLARASSYVTGHNLVVDGGWTAW